MMEALWRLAIYVAVVVFFFFGKRIDSKRFAVWLTMAFIIALVPHHAVPSLLHWTCRNEKCQKSGRINSKYWRDSFVFGSWKQDSWLSRVLFFHHMEMISFQTFATEFCVADVNEAPLRCLGYTHIMKLKHGWLIVCSSSRWFSFCSLSSLISQRNKLRFAKKDESFSIFSRFLTIHLSNLIDVKKAKTKPSFFFL